MNDFVRGADISQLPQLEYDGARYFLAGEQMDCLAILRQQGINAVRIKVWNDPGNPDFFPANQGCSLGFNSPAQVILLAKRAAALGFRIMIDFHYSDWWADPQKQFMPHAWQSLSLAAVAEQLSAFTLDVLQRLRAAGVTVEWVQLGNEITHGMLWPLAFLPGKWPELAYVLTAGAAAVRAFDPACQIVLHLDAGADHELCRRWFSEAIARKVPFDVIGLSFYPCWHGSLALLRDNLDSLAQCYGKSLLVVETAYPRKLDPAKNQHWLIQHCGSEPFPATETGQAQFLQALSGSVRAVAGGLGHGVFYWEPAMIPAPVCLEPHSVWENVTLFDEQGAALSSLAVFGRS